MSSTAIYAGTFDPFTNGHDDIVKRSLKLFDKVIILLAVSPNKNTLFTVDERITMLRDHFKDNKAVSIDHFDGLVVDYAKNENINVLVRGLRPTGDFETEFQMASMNQRLLSEIETVFLVTEGQNYYISSSLVKEIFKHGRDVKEFVPESIYDVLQTKLKTKK